VPGLFFLGYAHRLTVRDIALQHVAALAHSRGVLDTQELANELNVPRPDADRILRAAIREGHARGAFEAEGRFVALTAPRCPSCGQAVRRAPPQDSCPACRAAIAR